MGVVHETVEVGSAPDDHALRVEGGHVGAEGRPLDVGLRPPRPRHHLHGVRLGVLVDTDLDRNKRDVILY